jgi:hypothetical protein
VSISPARRILLATVSEADFLAHVIEQLKFYGWEYHHQPDSRRSTEGWPDITAVRPPRRLEIELKAEDGKLSAKQIYILGLLRRCPGIEVYVWRPSDEREISEVLAR